jgi:hypothetical protein
MTEPRRVELILPMRTVLLVAATLGVLAAFVAIGETFLIVFQELTKARRAEVAGLTRRWKLRQSLDNEKPPVSRGFLLAALPRLLDPGSAALLVPSRDESR